MCLTLLQLFAFVVIDVVVVIVAAVVVAVVIVAAVLLNNIFSSKTRTHISSFVCQTRTHSNEQKSQAHIHICRLYVLRIACTAATNEDDAART